MADGRFISYCRVSTGKQGASGLGLEGQRATVLRHLNGGDWQLMGEYVEVETAVRKKGRVVKRPQLEAALTRCRVMGAKLIVAKIDRLTRDPDFMTKLTDAGVDVWFCDMPKVEGPVGKFQLRNMLAVAELEAGMISERTKAALAAAKDRGTKLGGDRGNLPEVSEKGRVASLAVRQEKAQRRAADLAPIVAELKAGGATTLQALADGLNGQGIRTPRGGSWSRSQVRDLLATIGR